MRDENAATHVKKRYQGGEGKTYHQKHDVPQTAQKWIARYRAEKLSPYINTDDIVLEYGVGPGWNLEAITCKQRLGHDLSTFFWKINFHRRGSNSLPIPTNWRMDQSMP